MKVKVPFYLIKVNSGREGLEIVFPYGRKWYRLEWSKVPDKFKILYIAMLKLQGIEIPEHLKQYERDVIDLSDTDIEIDLSECEEIPETYQL